MVNRKWSHVKQRQTLEYSVVYMIAYRTLVEKMDVRSVAKELRLKPRQVADIKAAKSHKEHWVNAIAELAKAGLLNG